MLLELNYSGLIISEDIKCNFKNHKELLLKVRDELTTGKKYGFFNIYLEDDRISKDLSKYLDYLKEIEEDSDCLSIIDEIEVIRNAPVILNGNEDINNIIKIIENDDLDIFDYLGCGESANVYAYDNYCIKIFKEDDGYYRYSNKDAYVLEFLQGIECVPKLYAYKHEKYLIMEFIDGVHMGDALAENKSISGIRRELRKELYKIYKKGIKPGDLHLYNILYDADGNYKMIDFGMYSRDTSIYNNVEVEPFKTKEDINRKLNVVLNNFIDMCEKQIEFYLKVEQV